MDKNTLSNYGWIVIAVLVLSVMIALATPFGEYIKAGVESTTAGLFDTSEKAMNVVGMSAIPDNTYYTTEQVNADEHLYAVGSGSSDSKRIYVVAKFNEDYTEVVFTKNGNDSNGILATNSGQIEHLKGVKSATIKSGIVNIPESLFYQSATLKNVSIPKTVTSIGDNAFLECSALESIDIPNGVKTIGSGAFQKCTALTTITLHEGLESFDYRAFQNCTSLKSIIIPNTVTNLSTWTFTNCYALENVTLSKKITTIGEKTFLSCTALKSIVIPEGVTRINTQAFGYCSALENVTIPSTVTTIADDAFTNCKKLTTIYGVSGSYAETWATTNGYTFIAQ